MDPRPYHFEYRRPRLNNPTYESLKLYESIYQVNGFRKINPEQAQQNLYSIPVTLPQKAKPKPQPQRSTPQSQPEQLKRNQSYDLHPQKQPQSTRYTSRTPHKQSRTQKLNSSLSQYGNNLVNNMTSMQLLDQNRIYEKQEKQFNIISYQPKAYMPRLKNYPRLTLEDRIIEKQSHSERGD